MKKIASIVDMLQVYYVNEIPIAYAKCDDMSTVKMLSSGCMCYRDDYIIHNNLRALSDLPDPVDEIKRLSGCIHSSGTITNSFLAANQGLRIREIDDACVIASDDMKDFKSLFGIKIDYCSSSLKKNEFIMMPADIAARGYCSVFPYSIGQLYDFHINDKNFAFISVEELSLNEAVYAANKRLPNTANESRLDNTKSPLLTTTSNKHDRFYKILHSLKSENDEYRI